MFRKVIFSLIIFLAAFYSTNASAASRFNIIGPTPVTDGGPFFSVLDSSTLAQWQWSLGTALIYAHRPLTAMTGGTKVDIVGRTLAEHFYGSIGFTNWFNFSLNMPIVWHNRFRNPDSLPQPSNKISLSDLEIILKFRLLSRERFPIGLSLAPFVTIPTGKEDYFVGDDGFTGGARMIVDADIGKRVTLAANVGGLARKRFNAYGLNFKEQFLLSSALSIKIIDLFSVVGEIETRTPFGNFLGTRDTTLTEGRAGLQWHLGRNRNMILNTGANFGITYGAGVPRFGIITAFTYKSSVRKPRLRKAIEPLYTSVHFGSGEVKITDKAAMILSEIADLILNARFVEEILLEGHTDSVGSRSFNKALGKRRADAVQNYLRRRTTVDPQKLVTISHGEERPIDTNKTSEGRAKNRRVEVHVTD